jgi:hypothetical protein
MDIQTTECIEILQSISRSAQNCAILIACCNPKVPAHRASRRHAWNYWGQPFYEFVFFDPKLWEMMPGVTAGNAAYASHRTELRVLEEQKSRSAGCGSSMREANNRFGCNDRMQRVPPIPLATVAVDAGLLLASADCAISPTLWQDIPRFHRSGIVLLRGGLPRNNPQVLRPKPLRSK